MNGSVSPDISVIITFYNARKTLIEAVESLLHQSFRIFEVLLVDDGSSDGSMSLLSEIDDERLVRYQAGRIGRAAALNFGLEKAVGEYVAILDADDIALPNRFFEQKTILDTQQAIGLVCSSIELVDENGKDIGFVHFPTEHEDLCNTLLELNPFAHSSVMYRRKIALKVGGYNQRCEKSIDFNFYLDLLSVGVIFSGQKKAQIQLRCSSESWGKSDGKALQMQYGILGLINYYFRLNNDDEFLRGEEKHWKKVHQCFVEWFKRKRYQQRYEAKKHLHSAKMMLAKKRFINAASDVLAAFNEDYCCLCYRGVGFKYPRDVKMFVKWMIEKKNAYWVCK